jgi:hypothetical protein
MLKSCVPVCNLDPTLVEIKETRQLAKIKAISPRKTQTTRKGKAKAIRVGRWNYAFVPGTPSGRLMWGDPQVAPHQKERSGYLSLSQIPLTKKNSKYISLRAA